MVVLTFTGRAIADQQPLAAAAEIVRRQSGGRIVVVPALAGVHERLDQVIRFTSEGRGPAAHALVRRIAQRHRELAAKVGGIATAELTEAIEAVCGSIDAHVAVSARVRAVSAGAADEIFASGPLLSSRIVAAALEQCGIPAAWLDARRLILLEGNHGHGLPSLAGAQRIAAAVKPVVEGGRVPVLAGSIGANASGVTMTMGAEGTTLSAAVVAASSGAHELHVWADTDGVRAAEPALVGDAHTVPQLSFAEAKELATAGAGTLDAATIDIALARGTPVRIRNVRRPEQPGTVVNGKASANRFAPAALVCRRPDAVLHISAREPIRGPAFMRRVLDICEEHQVDPVLTLTSGSAVIAAFRERGLVDRVAVAAGAFADVRPMDDVAMLSAVGESLTLDPRVAAEVVGALGDVTLHAVVRHPSGRVVSVLLDEADAAAATSRVYERFFGRGAAADASAIDPTDAQ